MGLVGATPFVGVSAAALRRTVADRSFLHARLAPSHAGFWRGLVPRLENLAATYQGGVFELGDHGGGRHAETSIEPTRASAALAAGATVRYAGVQDDLEPIAAWMRGVASLLSAGIVAANANLYRSEPGSGLPAHYDGHDILVVQLSGGKRWRAAANDCAVPGRNQLGADLVGGIFGGFPPPPPSPRWRSIELDAGEALFLPAGTWHETRALGPSLSLTCGFLRHG